PFYDQLDADGTASFLCTLSKLGVAQRNRPLTRAGASATVDVPRPYPSETFPMTRFALLCAFALATILPAAAAAQPAPAPVPAPAPAPPPAAPGTLQIVDGKVEKDKLTWSDTVAVPVQKQAFVEVEMNGNKVLVARVETVYEFVSVTKAIDLKSVKVTDAAGK